MRSGTPLVRVILQECDVIMSQRDARILSESVGMNRVDTYSIMTSATELANNLFFHAIPGGTITLSTLMDHERIGFEIVAQDEGPGIGDIPRALEDGYSTNGGLGGGLPGVYRLMDEFEINSRKGGGTCVTARKWQKQYQQR